jgi:hypothetical protein
MQFEETAFIRNVSSLEDEEGNSVDAIELTDERVLAISGDAVTLFENMEQLQDSLEGEVDRPRIDL